MRKYVHSVFRPTLVPALMLALAVALSAVSPALAGEKVTVTDLLGRQVTVETPVRSIVLAGATGSGNPFYTLFALLGDDAPKTIVGMDQGLKKNRHWFWKKYLERYPELETIPDVGAASDLNVEKVIALKPDVVMATAESYKSGKDAFDTLEKIGIPVITNDYHAETLDTHVRSMQLIGDVVGRPERVKELIDFYKAQCAVVEERLAKAGITEPRVYVECGQDPKEYKNSYGRSMWGLIIPRTGGRNIVDGVVEYYGPVSAEYVLKADPQVVILTGANWPTSPDSLQLGYYADTAEARKRLAGFLSRPGWADMDAVKNKRVFGIHHGLSREIWDFYPIQCFAKWMHPELFEDLNPLDGFKEFHEKFLGVEYSGTWAVELD